MEQAFAEIHRLEAQLTVFSESSEVSRLNRRAASKAVAVEAGLVELLSLSKRLSGLTGGAFDPTSAPLSRCWGFLAKSGRVPSREELEEVLERVGCRFLNIDEGAGTIGFQRPLELNLGAIGKGYALDRSAGILRRGMDNFLLHAGHSTILAEGAGPGGSQGGLRIGLRHPRDHNRNFLEISLRRGALSTSGAAEQKFSLGGREYGHIVDPRSGEPAQCNLSATALAPTAAVADALSTAFYVMTVGEVEDFCRANPEVGAVVVPSCSEGELEVHRFGVESRCWEGS